MSNKDLSYRYKIVYFMDYPPPPLYENVTTALLSPQNSETNKKRYSLNKQGIIYVVLAFTEEQAIRIREYGLSVIRLKYCIKNRIDLGIYVTNKYINYTYWVFDVCEKLLNCMRDAAIKLSDIFKTLKEKIEFPTPRRYQFVKDLGNIGYRKYDVVVKTRTYLARSNC